jgi:hypothetical protein
MKKAALLLLLLVACRRETAPPPLVEITTTSSTSAWRIARAGSAIAANDRWVFISPALDSETRNLPGVTFGDAKGPRYGLLSGYFAPLIAPASSGARADVKVELAGDLAKISFPPDLTITINTANRAVIEGRAVILPHAEDTEINASLGSRPIASFRVTAGDDPSSRILRADRLQIQNQRDGTLTIESACPEVTTPTKRGSTSVFVVALGPNPVLSDPLFGAPDAAPQKDCSPSRTSTLAFP